ncbi:MAG: PRC-barrel domain-containing protein [Endomicrobium sp.]|jgi:16S rRNA processing protein RimM|nr:PRC-barrel domain-containing protein [Endomicrobium sp.]
MNRKIKWEISEILGFDVFNQSGECLGVLYDVLATGSNDVWVVRYYDEEILIPALKNIIKDVNLADKKILLSLPKEYEKVFVNTAADCNLEYNGYTIYED